MSDLSEAPKIERAPNRTSPVNLLAGISVRVSVEVGSTMMTIAELATLEAGNVVALDRKVGEPLDICANGSLVARGEIVSVDGRYGIRITELVSAEGRG
ncbi:flagellar motor switch protein FliN [Sphingorhabdus sp.]|jgi:flagellar motor switch protein FliN/FliY|uniref:flagellar motor switch protein FliN n=1 Tax=Sphingorhabdus sp. TaxID=1902408 RepID=UPI002D17BB9C|nr:flagellar motor switch protein FliN [Sphingorhabdus sp.]HMT41425.1 flagellar motor switch protein FliN [Sphingorhabdus sp.]